MLDNSQNVLVTGGTFTHVEQRGTPAFLQLRAAIADGAMHNSGERFNPPKCYPGTRQLILKQLLNWILEHDREAFMRWLHGPAGAGKSAILQEIAEMCAERYLLIASFFFSRTAALRNDEKRLAATISYQLAQSIPQTRPHIEAAIEHDPAIFSKSLRSQLLSLIVVPLNQACAEAREECSRWPHLILIDGVDECGTDMSQQHLITALKSSATACHFPITFLISSRPEVHLVVTFNQDDVKKAVVSTGLDHSYSPQDDIRLFLEGTFADIKQKHPLRGYLPPDWPSSEAVNTLVRKSSGQFIYAATAARYVSPPDVHPIERLDIVLGVTPSIGHESPFAELDALYFHILSSLPNSNEAAAMRIIALLVYPKRREYWTAEKFDSFLELRSGSSQQILGRLASIVDSGSHIRILHASIADFLFDAARSLKFFIDLPTQSTQFCRLCLRHFVSGTDYSPFRHALDNIARYCQNAAMSEELWNELVNLDLPAMARACLKFESPRQTTLLFDRREGHLRRVIRQYLHCSSIIQDRFPDQGSLVYSKCRQATCDFVKSEITLHYRSTSPLLATLLVLYALDPIPVLGHSKIQIDAQLHGQSHSVNFVDFLLVPTQHHEFESLLEIDDSSLQLYVAPEPPIPIKRNREDVYSPFLLDLLTGEDVLKAMKHLVTHIHLPRSSITAEDRCRYSLLFGPNPERSFNPSYEITKKDEVIMTLKQEAYAAALDYLLVLLPDTRADPELSDLLRSADIQWESRDPATLRPRVEAAIDNYLLRSESMNPRQIGGVNNSQSSEQFDSSPWRLRTSAQQALSPSREFSDFPVFYPGAFQRPFRTILRHREPEGDLEGEKEPNSCTSGENGKAGSHDSIENTAKLQDVQSLLQEDREEVHIDNPRAQSFKASMKAWWKRHLRMFQRRLPGLRAVKRGVC